MDVCFWLIVTKRRVTVANRLNPAFEKRNEVGIRAARPPPPATDDGASHDTHRADPIFIVLAPHGCFNCRV